VQWNIAVAAVAGPILKRRIPSSIVYVLFSIVTTDDINGRYILILILFPPVQIPAWREQFYTITMSFDIMCAGGALKCCDDEDISIALSIAKSSNALSISISIGWAKGLNFRMYILLLLLFSSNAHNFHLLDITRVAWWPYTLWIVQECSRKTHHIMQHIPMPDSDKYRLFLLSLLPANLSPLTRCQLPTNHASQAAGKRFQVGKVRKKERNIVHVAG
jgi:hypothetical protein